MLIRDVLLYRSAKENFRHVIWDPSVERSGLHVNERMALAILSVLRWPIAFNETIGKIIDLNIFAIWSVRYVRLFSVDVRQVLVFPR